ncbi:MAG TPA: VWA domain-containing protein, partial [Terriglobales bacterium]|nr:VWA domain-containing protein [Terriglobales bacterium]
MLPRLFLTLAVSASAFGLQESQPPTFHAATHLVQINVVVRDRDNRPALGLTKDDFLVSDRGKPQTISVFSADTAAPASAPSPQPPLPPNTFSNRNLESSAARSGATIILLDNLNTLESTASQPYESSPFWLEALALASAKRRLLEFLQQLDSADHIAIYGLSDTLHVLCDFTCTRDQLIAVVTRYDTSSKTRKEEVEPGQFSAQVTPDPQADAHMDVAMQQMASFNNERRAEVTMTALDAIAAHVADLPGRKSLLWLTANLPFSGAAIARILARGSLIAYPIDARGLLPRESGENNKEGYIDEDAYARGELARHADYPQPVGISTMQKMAEDTGGRAFVNTNDLTGAIRSAIEDSAATYTLGFYIDASAVDDKFHEVKVQLRRAGLTVRQPKGYFALKDTPTVDERRRNFARAVRSPIDSAAIPLQVTARHGNQPGSESIELRGTIGLAALQLAQTSGARKGAFDVYVVEQDAAGTPLGQSANRLALNLTEQQYQDYLLAGVAFREAVKPLAGATTLRVLIQDEASSAV